MKTIFQNATIVILLSAMVLACEKPISTISVPEEIASGDIYDISVNEAKTAFEKYSEAGSQVRENGKNKKKWKKDPLWKFAIKEKLQMATQ